jgi:hypothetical protein
VTTDIVSAANSFTEVLGVLEIDGVARLGGTNLAIKATHNASLANNGTMSVGLTSQTNFAIIFVQAGGAAAQYALQSSANVTQEMDDPSAVYTNTAGTASSINIYWSAGNSRYELENKRGSAIAVRIWILEGA